MSGAVHTPGPWVLGRTIGGHIDIDAPHAPVKWTALARVVVETEAVNGYSRDPEADANARLIACAPCLLDALEVLLDEGHSYESEGMSRDHARQIVARARGETA